MSKETKTEKSNFNRFGVGPMASMLVSLASSDASAWSSVEIKKQQKEGWEVAGQQSSSDQKMIADGLFCEANVQAAITFVRAKGGGDDDKAKKKKDGPDDGDNDKDRKPKPDAPEPTHGKEMEQEEENDLDVLEAFEAEENYALDARNAQDYFLHELPLVQDVAQQIEMALLGAELVPGNPAYTLPATSILQQAAMNLPVGTPEHGLMSLTLDHLSNPNPIALAPEHHQKLASLPTPLDFDTIPHAHMDNEINQALADAELQSTLNDAPYFTQFELDAPSFTMPDLNNFNMHELVNAPNMSADIASQALAMDTQGGMMSQFQDNIGMTEPVYEMAALEQSYDMGSENNFGQSQQSYSNNPYFIQNTLNMSPAPNMSDPAFGGSGVAAGSGADSGGDAGGGFSAN